jgi:hypothetical protein
MPENEGPKLSKAELAAFDFLIADAEEKGSFTTNAAWTAVAREVVKAVAKEAVFEAVREVARRAVGNFQTQSLTNIDESELQGHLNEALKKEGLTVDELIVIRKLLTKE